MREEAQIYLEEIEQIPLLSAQEFHTLLTRAAVGDETAQMELVNANLRLVVECARNYVGQGAPFSDLIQEGNIGLMKAVKKFSTKAPTTFIEYARDCIEAAIEQGLRELKATESVLPNMAIKEYKHKSESAGLSLVDLLMEEESRLNRKQLTELLREALDTLTMQEKKILVLRFGLGRRRTYSAEEVAAIFKISPNALQAIEMAALKKLSNSERLKKLHQTI